MSLDRKLASIQVIKNVEPAENADALALATVNNWRCVVQKSDNLKIGDKVLFFETDAFLPLHPIFDFLKKSSYKEMETESGGKIAGYRLRTIKLRGNISQGLIIPLTVENVNAFYLSSGYFLDQMEIGTDVTNVLGIKLYEPPIPEDLKGKVYLFPGFLNKTGAERLQNVNVNNLKHIVYYATEKIDGVSTTFYKLNGEFGTCSRNWGIYESDTYPWRLVKQLNLIEKLPEGFAIQGEAIGQGTNAKKLVSDRLDFYVFNVYNIKSGNYLSVPQMIDFCDHYNLKHVPLVDMTEIDSNPYNMQNIVGFSTFEFSFIDDDIELFKFVANLKSQINDNVLVEGIVLHVHENFNVLYPRIKVISKEYEFNNG